MNYKIINDHEELDKFIEWLPELNEGECYLLTVFARKKYHPSANNDKIQCKRVTATSKEWLWRKIMQMDIPLGLYTNKDGTPVSNDALALYITVNPRSLVGAQKKLLKKLVDVFTEGHVNMNPASLAMSAIQSSKSRTVYVDLDFDNVKFEDCISEINGIINEDAYSVLETRGGFHLLVSPNCVEEKFKKTWYKKLTAIPQCDVTGDNLIPVAGCCQGGFTPTLIR